MRKRLIASAALVVMGATSAQAAEPIKLTIGGFLQEVLAYTDNNTLNKGNAPRNTQVQRVEQSGAGIISLRGSTKLDNGLAPSVNIDLMGTQAGSSRNANATCARPPWGPFNASSTGGAAFALSAPQCNNNTAVVRSYGTLASNFGTIVLGEREDSSYIIHTSAPDVSPVGPVGDGLWYNFLLNPGFHRIYLVDNDSWYNGRTTKATYISPSLYGAALAFSYNPSMNYSSNSSSPTDASSSDTVVYSPQNRSQGQAYNGDLYSVGLAYNNTFGDVRVKGDFSVMQANVANLRMYNGGTQVGFAGFTIGGSFLNREVPSDANIGVGNTQYTTAASIASLPTTGLAVPTWAGVSPTALARALVYAGNNWTAGISYALGPYAVSFAYFHDNSKSIVGLNGTGQADSTSFWEFGASWTAGPGVQLKAGAGYAEYKGGVATPSQPWNNLNKGPFFATGMRVDF